MLEWIFRRGMGTIHRIRGKFNQQKYQQVVVPLAFTLAMFFVCFNAALIKPFIASFYTSLSSMLSFLLYWQVGYTCNSVH